MSNETGDTTDSTGTTARPAADPGIDPADLQQASAVQADAEATDPDGNEAREEADPTDTDVAAGIAPFGVGRFGASGQTLNR